MEILETRPVSVNQQAVELLPFRFDRFCSKCLWNKSSWSYQPPNETTGVAEHLVKTCLRCGYWWAETVVIGGSAGEGLDDSTRISELQFSMRVRNVFSDAGIRTLGDLVAKRPSDLLCMRGFGSQSFDEVVTRLHSIGRGLGDEREPRE